MKDRALYLAATLGHLVGGKVIEVGTTTRKEAPASVFTLAVLTTSGLRVELRILADPDDGTGGRAGWVEASAPAVEQEIDARCDQCKKHKPDAHLRTNPYNHDVHNMDEEDCQQVLCDECEQILRDDI